MSYITFYVSKSKLNNHDGQSLIQLHLEESGTGAACRYDWSSLCGRQSKNNLQLIERYKIKSMLIGDMYIVQAASHLQMVWSVDMEFYSNLASQIGMSNSKLSHQVSQR